MIFKKKIALLSSYEATKFLKQVRIAKFHVEMVENFKILFSLKTTWLWLPLFGPHWFQNWKFYKFIQLLNNTWNRRVIDRILCILTSFETIDYYYLKILWLYWRMEIACSYCVKAWSSYLFMFLKLNPLESIVAGLIKLIEYNNNIEDCISYTRYLVTKRKLRYKEIKNLQNNK